VAIDCPGYGISEGSKQLVRSYPGDLVEAVLRSLGRRSAVCLVGSSQGAAAVLNALYEKPSVAFGAFVLHPVTMTPEKFSKLEAVSFFLFFF
jgi:predicted esterase